MDELQPPRRGGPPWRSGARSRTAAGLPWVSTAVLLVFVMVGTGFAEEGQGRRPLDLAARLLLLVAVGVLLLRRRRPVVAVATTCAATLVHLAAGYPYGPVFVAVAVGCFSAIVTGHREAAWWSLGGLWAGHVLVSHWLYRWLPPDGDRAAPWTQQGFITAWVVAVVAVVAAAELLRVRREQWAAARAEREAAERRRADEERLRMARELHDVLAHSVSVINVQAGVGLALLDSDPEQARTALTTIAPATGPRVSWSRTPSRRNCCARYGRWSAGTRCSPRA
ncbi:histidine kinase dimerization/phosphoacceptor domain-containing protein [Streptomyces globisporus]